jgi:hypothetical protein
MRVFGLFLVAVMLLAACEQLGWQRIPAAEDPESPAPAIRWVSPAVGAPLSGSVTFRVEPVGDVDFTQVDFFVEDIAIDSSTTGVVTFNVDFLGLTPGPVRASARAMNSDGVERTAYRAFAVVDPKKPMVSWVAPLALRDYAPYEHIDLSVQVADLSGTITSLVFMVDGNVVHTRTNLTGVDTMRTETFRWIPGFYVSLDRKVPLTVIAENADGGVTTVTRDIISIPPRLTIPDTEPPLVWWDQASVWNDKAVVGQVNFRARAQDNVQVSYFDFLINGALHSRKLANSDNSSLPRSWAELVWDTAVLTSGTDGQSQDQRLYPDGMYEVTVEAVDTSNNRSIAAVVNVRVANDDKIAPQAMWYYDDGMLHQNAILSGTAELTLLGRDFGGSGVVAFDVFVDSVQVARIEDVYSYVRVRSGTDGFMPGSIATLEDDEGLPVPFGFDVAGFWDWDTTQVLSGHYNLGLIAYDAAGNASPMTTVRVLVHPIFRVYVDPTAGSYLGYSEPNDYTKSPSDLRRQPGTGDRLARTLTVLPDAPHNDYTTVCWVRLTAGWELDEIRPVSMINGEGPSPSTGAFSNTGGATINSWTFVWNPDGDTTEGTSESDYDFEGYQPIEVWGDWDYDDGVDPSTTQTVLGDPIAFQGQSTNDPAKPLEYFWNWHHGEFFFGAQVGVSYSAAACSGSLGVTVLNAVPVLIEEDIWYSTGKACPSSGCGGTP